MAIPVLVFRVLQAEAALRTSRPARVRAYRPSTAYRRHCGFICCCGIHLKTLRTVGDVGGVEQQRRSGAFSQDSLPFGRKRMSNPLLETFSHRFLHRM